MISAKMMSDKIRMKRKQVKADGVENMVDTDPHPQMNPQDILDEKYYSHMEEAMDLPEKNSAPSDPADNKLDGTQDMEELKKRMSRIEGIFNKLSVG